MKKTYYIITAIIFISLAVGMAIGWSTAYERGFKDCWNIQEADLIRNRATEFERWVIGHGR